MGEKNTRAEKMRKEARFNGEHGLLDHLRVMLKSDIAHVAELPLGARRGGNEPGDPLGRPGLVEESRFTFPRWGIWKTQAANRNGNGRSRKGRRRFPVSIQRL